MLRIAYRERPAQSEEETSNWILFYEDGTTDMIISHFKTSKCYWFSRIKASDYKYVNTHLKTTSRRKGRDF